MAISKRICLIIIILFVFSGLIIPGIQAQSKSPNKGKSSVSRAPVRSSRPTYNSPTRSSSSRSTYNPPTRSSSSSRPPSQIPSRTPSVRSIPVRTPAPSTRIAPRAPVTRPDSIYNRTERIPSSNGQIIQRTQVPKPKTDISVSRESISPRKGNETTTSIRERIPTTRDDIKIDRTRTGSQIPNSRTSTNIKERTPQSRENIPASQTSSFVKNRQPQKQYHKPTDYNRSYHNDNDYYNYGYYNHGNYNYSYYNHGNYNYGYNYGYRSWSTYSGFSYFGNNFSISTNFLWSYPYTYINYQYPVYTPYVYFPIVYTPYIYSPWWIYTPYQPYYYPSLITYECDYFIDN